MDFFIWVVAALACAYLTKIFLLQEKDSHEGPFVLKNIGVFFQDTGHFQKAALFDVIRRLFGVYETKKVSENHYIWTVKPLRAEAWSCPFCLSFWMSLVVNILFLSGQVKSIPEFVLSVFAIAAVSSWINVKGYE
jgi:hypothetical protein